MSRHAKVNDALARLEAFAETMGNTGDLLDVKIVRHEILKARATQARLDALLQEWRKLGRGDGIHGRQLAEIVESGDPWP